MTIVRVSSPEIVSIHLTPGLVRNDISGEATTPAIPGLVTNLVVLPHINNITAVHTY